MPSVDWRVVGFRVTAFHLTARIPIIAETDDYIVVDKPPFLEAHPSKPGGKRTLWDELRDFLAFEIVNGGQVSIINRLDRETSGLTLIAKNRDAARAFTRMMMNREFQKEYVAIVWGWPEVEAWTVEAPLLRLGSVEPFRVYLKQGVHPTGSPAVTRFQVIERFTRPTTNGDRFAMVRAFPETGRTHQIRVHLAHSGHSIVGDKIYGPSEECYLEFIETGWTESLRRRLLLPRHALHAGALSSPAADLAWRAAVPADLARFIQPG